MSMKHRLTFSLSITAVIAAAAIAAGFREEQRLSSIRERVARKEAAMDGIREAARAEREKKIQAEHSARIGELKATAVSHLDWFDQFHDPGNPKATPSEEDIARICGRLQMITPVEAVFILKEYQSGRRMTAFPGHWILRECLFKLAESEPLAAIDFLQSFEKQWKGMGIMREFGQQVIGDSVISMAKSDPLKAVEWLKAEGGKFDGQIPEMTKQALLYHVAGKDPFLAFGLIRELDLSDKEEAVAAIVRTGRTDAERKGVLVALRSYLAALPDEKAVQAAAEKGFQALAYHLMAEGPEGVERWAAAEKLSSGELGMLIGGIYPTAGTYGEWLDWLDGVPAGEGTDVQITRLFRAWAYTDHRAAAVWLDGAPDGRMREVAVQTYAAEVARYEPEVAVEWGLTLPAGERRQATLREIYRNWPKADDAGTAAAEAFARKHGIGGI